MAEALGAWVLNACPQHEAEQVEAHAATCPECAAEARRLMAVAGAMAAGEVVSPPAELRDRVRATAFGRRAPSPWQGQAGDLQDAAASYTAAVGALDALLEELTAAQWRERVLRDWDVEQVLDHLTASDQVLAGQLLRTAEGSAGREAAAGAGRARASWRAQADALLERVGAAGQTGLGPVRLADPELPRQPVGFALVQRTFETWIHADDIRTGLGRAAEPPPAEHLRLVAELGVRLLPVALRRLGREHPGRSARLVLEGEGGRAYAWTVPLAADALPGLPDVTIRMELTEFCYLLGNRRQPGSVARTVQGEHSLALDLLTAAATLGCGD